MYDLEERLKATLLERPHTLEEALAAIESLKFELLLSQMDMKVFMTEVARAVGKE